MEVKFEFCPEDYAFYSKDENGYASIKFKGNVEASEDIPHILVCKAISFVSCITVAEHVCDINDSFDFNLLIPYGYNYHITFELLRKNNEEWISYIRSFNHISIGDVFIIAGQSNAVGYARGAYENSFDDRIHNFKLSDEWDIASHPLNNLSGYKGDIKRDSGEYSQHITMAKKIITHTGIPIAFIPCAVGGTEISRWNKRYNGDLYYDMLRRVSASRTSPIGVIWCQGANDTFSEEKSQLYYQSLKELISDIREDIKNTNLKFFIYQINRCMCASQDRDLFWDRVREAQRKVAYEDENVYVVSSFGAGLMEDKIHNSPSGCDLIGERMASVVLKNLYGKNFSANVPMAEKVSLINDNQITVCFNNETYLISDNVNKKIFDFSVFDESGKVEISEMVLERNKVVLKTDRPIKNKFTVIGASGSNPKNEIPCDLISRIPMLSFMIESE